MGEGIEATAVHICCDCLCVLIGVTCMATLNHESRVLALRQWAWLHYMEVETFPI